MKAIELFSCSGALAAGFRDAGIAFDLAFDRDPEACESYAANLGVRPVQMDVRDLVRLLRAGWHPGPIDLVIADPPCAPWSMAGKRAGLADDRDMLRETVEAIALLRPRAYLIGNIPGLENAPNLGVVRTTIGALARDGYCVRDFATLDAADYGVPQRRVRPFWFGHREGPCLRWPARTHCDPAKAAQNTLPGMPAPRPWVTCREALAHLPVEEIGRPVRLRHEGKRATPRHPPSDQDAPARTLTASDGGGSKRSLVFDRGDPTAWPWDRPSTTVHADPRIAPPGHHEKSFLSTPDARDTRPKRDPSTRGPQSGRVGDPCAPARTLDTRVARVGAGESAVLGWPWDRPATTVCAGLDKLAPPGRSGSRGEHQSAHPNAIVLSERAACVLQGLPEGWSIVGATKRARWSQIGQAVPRIVAEAIARSILEQFASADPALRAESAEAVAC